MLCKQNVHYIIGAINYHLSIFYKTDHINIVLKSKQQFTMAYDLPSKTVDNVLFTFPDTVLIFSLLFSFVGGCTICFSYCDGVSTVIVFCIVCMSWYKTNKTIQDETIRDHSQ